MTYNKNYSHRVGFTIVELVVVIVVIAILASITAVTYSGIQKRAYDTKRRSDLSNISKMLNLYALKNNGDMFGAGSGCGSGGNGNGWWDSTEAKYPKSTKQCLIDAGYTEAASINDPSGCIGGSGDECIGKPRYMIVHCSLSGEKKVYLLAQLESEPQDSSFTDNLCDPGTSPGFSSITSWDESYGINYAVQVL